MTPQYPASLVSLSGLVLALSLAACGGGAGTATTVAEAPPADLAAATAEASQTLSPDASTWTPEALEDLLAPVALYPDPVLAQLLVAVTNPQEVLDAGNWLIANPDLTGKGLDQAAQTAGFTMPMRSLMQFPDVVDKLCLNMDWTGELGQAYVNDQQGVMDAVQRLRVQARDVGNLASSPQMTVETKKEAGQPDVVTVSPPSPQVVYVPQYDPQAVYAPATAPAAPATTTTTTTTTQEGHSTGSLVATGLLAFGAGMLVNEIFDDDDHYHGSYYGNMWYRPMPYYPPYPYRPVYGPGFYPGNAYHRPPTYIRNGNTVVINQNNNYYDRYKGPQQAARTRAQPRSPISAARPNRPELQQLNAKAAQGPARRAPASSEAWKGKGAYAGSDPAVRRTLDQQASRAQRGQDDRTRAAARDTAARNTAGARPTPSVGGKAPAPKIQGSYAGAKPDRPVPSRPAAAASREARPQAAPAARPQPRPDTDRGHPAAAASPRPAASAAQARPQPQPQQARQQPAVNKSAVSRPSGPAPSAKSAGDRGRQSMPSGARNHPKRR